MVLQRDDHRGQAVLKFSLEDVAYLTSDEGSVALAAVEARPLTDRVSEIASLRTQFGDRTPVLVETVLLRRRAIAKLTELPGSAGWLLTDDALQQASAAMVALHRARRLQGNMIHDVTCSIGTELAALRAESVSAVGSDIDPVRLAMARHNLRDNTLLCRADALRPVTRGAVVLADPARRSGARRRFDPRAYQPALDALIDAYRDREIVVKCAPGIDFDAVARLGFDGEIEVTSYRGSVREACLWSAGLAEPGVRRRASILDRGEHFTDAEPDDCPVRAPGRWIVDPDGAVVRAGLVRHFAARYGLWQLDPHIAYLSGDELPSGLRGFEVLDQLGFDERRLRQALGALDCGSLEILVRGVDVDPDALRRRLGLRGSRSLALVVTRLGSGTAARGTAFVCRPSR
ncbi:THUMP-like domain-containing protein [Mycobacterium cookii]|uniref:THUMP-like domain-containing protein n=1 Tax=Mycobacterium cookii TaxID=1775 RepID=UPI001E535B6F|nr:class I SAM-dependent methyltransferase [Mycobacterium cookii]